MVWTYYNTYLPTKVRSSVKWLTACVCIPSNDGMGFIVSIRWVWIRFISFSRCVSANFTTIGDLQPCTYANLSRISFATLYNTYAYKAAYHLQPCTYTYKAAYHLHPTNHIVSSASHTTLGKFFTHMCLCSPSSTNWYRRKMGAKQALHVVVVVVEYGLTFHQTHYKSYPDDFYGSMIQPTVSKHWKTIVGQSTR